MGKLGQKLLGHARTLGKKIGMAAALGGALILGAKHLERRADKEAGYKGSARVTAEHRAEEAKNLLERTAKSRAVQAGMSKGKAKDLVVAAQATETIVRHKLSNRKLQQKHKEGQIAAGIYVAPPSMKEKAKDKLKAGGAKLRQKAKRKKRK